MRNLKNAARNPVTTRQRIAILSRQFADKIEELPDTFANLSHEVPDLLNKRLQAISGKARQCTDSWEIKLPPFPEPENTQAGKMIARIPLLLLAIGFTCILGIALYFAGHISGPISSFAAALLVLASTGFILKQLWSWLTGLTFGDFFKAARSHQLQTYLNLVPVDLRNHVKRDANTLLKWLETIISARSQLRLLRTLVTGAMIVGGTLIAYVTLQRLTEQISLMKEQNNVSKTATLTTIIDQQFQEENEAARDAFDKISGILLRAVSDHEPSSIEEQVWAIGQIPDAMRMKVTRAVEAHETDGLLSVERRVFLPNHAKLKTLFTQFIRMDRVGYTIRKLKHEKSRSPKIFIQETPANGANQKMGAEEFISLSTLGPISTAVLNTLYLTGPGTKKDKAELRIQRNKQTDGLKVLSAIYDSLDYVGPGINRRDVGSDTIKFMLDIDPARREADLQIFGLLDPNFCLWNLQVPANGFRIVEKKKFPGHGVSDSSISEQELNAILGVGFEPITLQEMKLSFNDQLEKKKTALRQRHPGGQWINTKPTFPLYLGHLPKDFFRGGQIPAVLDDGQIYIFRDGSDFTRTIFQGANLSHSYFREALFTEAGLDFVNFEHAELPGSVFDKGYLSNVKLRFSNLARATFRQTRLDETTNLFRASLADSVFSDCLLKGGDFPQPISPVPH